jgi:NAD(P)-dependent dehydrogenase (short-subunit alcohol dehydrogenase family)
VITGAGGNFGREGCIFFSARGAKINENAQIASFVCNVTDAASVQSAIDGAESEFGTPDMLWSE